MLYASRFIRLHSPPMEGPDILEVQTCLLRNGFDPGPPDGFFGLASATALRQFQKTHGLNEDGVVGPDTWLALTRHSNLEQLAELSSSAAYPRIHVHVDTRILTMTSNGTVRTYPGAVGKPSTPTPVGEWTIVFKSVDPGGPFGVRWMRLSVPWGGYGIHGTNNPNSIGKAVSHGCIRLYNEDVTQLYDLVPIGTPVSITGTVRKIRNLRIGMQGDDVREVQQMLLDLNYYTRTPSGYFGKRTRRAVLDFQKHEGLTCDGIAGPKTCKALQIAHDLALDDILP